MPLKNDLSYFQNVRNLLYTYFTYPKQNKIQVQISINISILMILKRYGQLRAKLRNLQQLLSKLVKHWNILPSKLSSDYTILPASIAKNHDTRTYQIIDFL